MQIEQQIKSLTREAIQKLYNADLEESKLILNNTPDNFDGDFTVVVFPFVKLAKKAPEATAEDVGQYLQEHADLIESYNIIKGFLNLTIKDVYWLDFLKENFQNEEIGKQANTGETVVVEYCGPNTNKPLHLGHVRNMLLGYSVANILEFNGNQVYKVNIYNDRGIAICKSMLSWQKYGEGATPESTGIKGDQLVGQYYVRFENENAKVAQSEGVDKTKTSLYAEAQEMLRQWEAGDEEIVALWEQMNSWVYEGFEQTYNTIGIDFHKAYYESDTYLDGKKLVQDGLDSGSFLKKEDGSVWVDLTDKGLDEKILLRSDGTSVYLTQDLGTAQERYNDYQMDRSIYVVANEQDYHFKVLKLTLETLGKPYAEGIFHLSYGLVNLPEGRMKTREGTVVDADQLIENMVAEAEEQTQEQGKTEAFSDEEAQELYHKIGLGALKFFMLRVDPKKSMLFDPKESIDLQGATGPFVQYTYARIQSVFRKAGDVRIELDSNYSLSELEKDLLSYLHQYNHVVQDAGKNLDPSAIVNYCYELAKQYNKMYNDRDHKILDAASENAKQVRLALSSLTAIVIRSGFKLLGIDVPDKM